MTAHSPSFLKAVEQAQKTVQSISIEQLTQLSQTEKNLKVVDVREDREVDEQQMPGALHIGKGVIDRDLENTIADKTTPIVFFCRSGYRSLIAAKQAQTMGYQNVYSLTGGFIAWCKANGIKPPQSPFSTQQAH